MGEPSNNTKHVCASCKDCMDRKDLQPGDFCNVHWAKIEAEVPRAGFYCEHHTR